MSPDQFWSLTPTEIYELADGYNQRQEMELQKLAWHAANVMNVHLPKRRQVTVKKLLGKEKKPMTEEQRKEAYDRLQDHIKRVKGGGNIGANRGDIS